MRKLIFLFVFILIGFYATAQDSLSLKKLIDSLTIQLKNVTEDTERVNILARLGNTGAGTLMYSQQALDLAKKVKFLKGESRARTVIGNYYWNISNYPAALENYLKSLKICEEINYKRGIAANLGDMGNVYLSLGNFRKALDYSFQSESFDKTFSSENSGFLLSTIAKAYIQLNMLDSALFFANESNEAAVKNKNEFYIALSLQALGDVFSKKNDIHHALYYYRAAIIYTEKTGYYLGRSGTFESMAELYQKKNMIDSAIYYAKQSLGIALPSKAMPVVVQAATFLYNIYKHSNVHASIYYLEIASAATDSIFNNQKNNELEDLVYNEEARQKDKEAAEIQYKSNLKLYGLIVIAAIIGIIALIQLRNNKQKKKANLLLERQKQKVEITLSELRSTQAQLVQSEKMASLGELTAGIAHEIQNPLNFVNNFSDVNTELLQEMKEEIAKGNYEEIKTIADNVMDNEQKINHHGKRADSIVKGMLQHSRTSSGQRELTDINTLADEYLRLAYHGLRAKEKSFNAKIETDFDESIGKINIVPQDIGRALLNLVNNAFYAVSEKLKIAGENYQPTISVQTKKINDKIEIKVCDNGNGIPKSIIDKIFQPFFTTKPTGQGTGLGLSLSYDIIKAHGGELKVETKEGEGTEFIIWLPV
jgi:two-component system NtrC family sensor kinase